MSKFSFALAPLSPPPCNRDALSHFLSAGGDQEGLGEGTQAGLKACAAREVLTSREDAFCHRTCL